MKNTKNKNLKVEAMNVEVSIITKENSDYISLTDIARFKDQERSDYIIQNWMRGKSVVEFIGLWEKINNSNFNSIEFDVIKNEAGSNSFSLTPKKWINLTSAIGFITKTGRYNSGTFAHKDIALEFASWISAEFKLYFIKEFQRLKEDENERLSLDWNAKRMLTKINYRIHTDDVREHLIPRKIDKSKENMIFASEADLLNVALFNKTAKEWRDENSDLDGNMRDYADVVQLVCLANLETINAEFIRQGLLQKERLIRLNESAIVQLKSLLKNNNLKKLAK
jgi:hypothetical protein